jgi:hypothetical protein
MIIVTIKITTQRDLAYRAVSLRGPARLPYKQALSLNYIASVAGSSIGLRIEEEPARKP